MKILVAEDISEKALEVLRTENGWAVRSLPKLKGASVEQEIADADALVVRSATKVTAELLGRAQKLRAIGRAGVGVDNIDLEAATRRGIVVMNTPGGNATSVAEHALALLLALARRIPSADASIKQGKWEKKKLQGFELRGKSLGLIGLGKIGSEVARLAQGFEMQVLAYDPYVSTLVAREQNVRLAGLEELLKASDVVSLHASATPETRHLLNRRTLGLAKPGLRVINCARGELVDEAALLEALDSGQVAGAGLDVFETEPPRNTGLVAHPNVVATPHIAGSTEEAQEIVGIRIAEQVRDYLLLGIARNAANMPSISPEEFKKLEPYIQLGEKLGVFLVQIAGERLEEVRISYDGGLAELNTHLVKNAVLKGILNRVLDEEANLVNAGTLAQARGLEVVEVRSARRAAFSNSLGIGLKTDAGPDSVLGMVGVRGALRILGINDVDIEAPLRGTILFIRNQDVPGVIGRVGTILGDRGVNIASFALGRNQEARLALGLVNVDSPIPDQVLDEIRAVPAIRAARVVEIG
ncbi:MAG: phosphoglycerate dehydrogenase [Acidobacteria bacterium]|nr:MAG: phosphoglycerate dehydrogenase [Acidobacteriota bacterium]